MRHRPRQPRNEGQTGASHFVRAVHRPRRTVTATLIGQPDRVLHVDIGRTITAPVQRAGALAQNALEVARFGGLETGEEASPYEVVARDNIHRLRRYYGGNDGPPVVLVPPMMLAAEVWDVSPGTSAVRSLHEMGCDTYVVDFGSPEHEEGGLERDLTDHVVAVSDAVDEVREITGRNVHLGGSRA